ncbi:MAG: carboxymuconolactone decarboxylase family protein [Gammaproteobacteria bacterium]|nr:carboxymuconolactone decarboxylase family protein [Gammaproteobacteria bacterium]
MARVALIDTSTSNDPAIEEISQWVTQMEGEVPNHFKVEMNFPEFFKAKLGATQVLWQMGELNIEEIQHVGIAVSKANGCSYCTAAFCTILNYGLKTDEAYVQQFLSQGATAIADQRLGTIVEFAAKVNADALMVTDIDIEKLRDTGLSDKGIVQLIHLVSDFASYNRLNLALQTDYDYRDMWRQIAFGWSPDSGQPEGDNTRGILKDPLQES